MAGEGRKVTKFFKEVKAEMKKVTWPTKDVLIKYTEVVLAVVIAFTALIFVADSIFSYLLKLVIKA